jgi:hypothetical protein
MSVERMPRHLRDAAERVAVQCRDGACTVSTGILDKFKVSPVRSFIISGMPVETQSTASLRTFLDKMKMRLPCPFTHTFPLNQNLLPL